MAALQENARMHRELKMKINKKEASDSEYDSGSEQQKVCVTICEKTVYHPNICFD